MLFCIILILFLISSFTFYYFESVDGASLFSPYELSNCNSYSANNHCLIYITTLHGNNPVKQYTLHIGISTSDEKFEKAVISILAPVKTFGVKVDKSLPPSSIILIKIEKNPIKVIRLLDTDARVIRISEFFPTPVIDNQEDFIVTTPENTLNYSQGLR